MGFFIDVEALPEGFDGFCQVIFLFVCYGYVLMNASNLISDGSELLLLVPAYAGIVGSVVLPILGAVPDGCIILFSGMGPNAQEQLAVGVGALAGSTIMLLTIPWFLSILGGRVDVVNGAPYYKGRPKLSSSSSLSQSGVAIAPSVRRGGWIMMGTAVTYFLLQGPGVYYAGNSAAVVASKESSYALFGMFVCFGFFAGYLYYQVASSQDSNATSLQDLRNEVIQGSIMSGDISLLGVMKSEFKHYFLKAAEAPSEVSSLTQHERLNLMRRLQIVMRPFFSRYDRDRSRALDIAELSVVFSDMGERIPQKELLKIFSKFDKDGSGAIDFQEFVEGTAEYIQSNLHLLTNEQTSYQRLQTSRDVEEGASEDAEEEEEDVPEDLLGLDPDEQQRRIKLRATYMLFLGTALVVIFSDPMVDVLSEIGKRTGVSSFYVSFVLAPLASNASELVAAYNYSLKKTPNSMAIALSTLQGAACMNNTFGLGIFMFLIYSQGLSWEYLAETLSILVVEVLVGFMSMKQMHSMIDALVILAFYPLSLGLVAGLEAVGWN